MLSAIDCKNPSLTLPNAGEPFQACRPISKSSWGRIIRDLRIENGLSEREFSLKAGITVKRLGDIEDGVHLPRIETLEKLLFLLGHEIEIMPLQTSSS